ncbi:hypothetical protein BGZ94_005724, partial [Podila epigama]
LESAIEKLEMEAQELTLADWKKNKVKELDKYMEAKRKELWDKAEKLATRSEQFQREESARKLQHYESQFERDMAQFLQAKREQEHEHWRALEENEQTTGHVSPGGVQQQRQRQDQAMPPTLAAIQPAAVPSSILMVRASSSEPKSKTTQSATTHLTSSSTSTTESIRVHTRTIGVLDLPDEPVLSVGGLDQDEDQREKEDLDKFLGSASEDEQKRDDEEEEDEDEEEDDEDEGEDDNDDDEENISNSYGSDSSDEEETSEDEEEEDGHDESMMDPIERARKARAAAAAAGAFSSSSSSSLSTTSKASERVLARDGPTGFKKNSAAMGSTISLFSTLAKHPSSVSISRGNNPSS